MSSSISRPKQTNRREAGRKFLSRLFVAGAAIFLLRKVSVGNGDPASEPDEPVNPMAFMLLIGGSENKEQGQVVNSRRVLDRCKELGVEFRRYSVDDDLFQEAAWVREMQQNGRAFGAPCVVIVDAKGRGHCEPVPASVEAALALLEAEYAV